LVTSTSCCLFADGSRPDGKVLLTDGPYTETKEHIGGFWILEAADLDEALAWTRKAAVAWRAFGRLFSARIRDTNPAEARKQTGHPGLGTRAEAVSKNSKVSLRRQTDIPVVGHHAVADGDGNQGVACSLGILDPYIKDGAP
jgi:hypothetical protein